MWKSQTIMGDRCNRAQFAWAEDVSPLPILNSHNSYLVSYTISDRPVLGMINSMLEIEFQTILDGTELILHSDQGWQYSTSNTNVCSRGNKSGRA